MKPQFTEQQKKELRRVFSKMQKYLDECENCGKDENTYDLIRYADAAQVLDGGYAELRLSPKRREDL